MHLLSRSLQDRYLTVLEKDGGYVPELGFVNGLAYPTGADLAVLVFLKSGFPFAKALRNANYNLTKFPKLVALAERTMAYPAIAAYIKTSKTFHTEFDGAKV